MQTPEQKYTPGPWKVEQGSAEQDFIVTDSTGVTLCEPNDPLFMHSRDYDEGLRRIDLAEARANARLIAAAPEAIEELLAIRAECMNWIDGDNKPWDARLSRIIERIDPIIQKAGVL